MPELIIKNGMPPPKESFQLSKYALLKAVILAVGGWAIYALWGYLGLPDAPGAQEWGTSARSYGWRMFFTFWIPISLACGEVGRCIIRGKAYLADFGRNLNWLASPLGIWLVLLLIGSQIHRWFGLMASAFILFWAVQFLDLFRKGYYEIAGNPHISKARACFLIAAVSFCLLIPLAGWMSSAISTTADELVYLLSAHSLAADGDLDLANQVAQRVHTGFYWGGWHKVFGEKPILDFPLVLTPAYVLGGRLGALFLLCLAGAFLLGLIYLLCVEVTQDRRAAAATWGLMAVSFPFLFGSLHVYPEMLAAVALGAGMWVSLKLPARPLPYLTAVAALAGFMLFLKFRYLPLGLGLIGFSLWQMRRHLWVKLLAGFLAIFLAIFVLWGEQTIQAFLSILPELRDKAWIKRLLFLLFNPDQVSSYAWDMSSWRALAGLFLDQEMGLFFFAPMLILFLPGAVFIARKHTSAAALCLFVTIPYIFGHCILNRTAWDAGFSFPTRFLVPILAVLGVLCGVAWHRLQGLASNTLARCILLLGAGISLLCLAQPQLMHSRLDGSNEILEKISGRMGIDLVGLFPSFTNTLPFEGLARHFNAINLWWLLILAGFLTLALGDGFYPALKGRLRGAGRWALAAGAGVLILGIFLALGCFLPAREIRGARMAFSGGTLFRDNNGMFTMLALRPGGRAWTVVRLPKGKVRLTLYTEAFRFSRENHDLISPKPPIESYDPQLEIFINGENVGRWRLFESPRMHVRPGFRAQEREFVFQSKGGRARLEMAYVAGGTKASHFIGVDLIRITPVN